MNQTGVCIDIPGTLTVDYVGTCNIDVIQGTSANGSQCIVFLCASATGIKYPPFIVFSGRPGGKVWAEVCSKTVGFPQYVHAGQRKAWTHHDHMVAWFDEVWAPRVDGCKLLILDSLKVHKMQDIKDDFKKKCHTQGHTSPA
ncbi:hypothetical protein PHMEG_0003979 [Phytophthora megakarya]|uniref:DDE-1 domain-containing protein n=1 Tax=Phytophthora megakarya TaxID=4795 RepID=A0A225WUX1_9STRA|nr:hypothetical protein PHMEG_0003979 [Phytophthora megakarya]